jgi:hypothetical protein
MNKILNELSGHAFIILVVVLMANGFSAAGHKQKSTAGATVTVLMNNYTYPVAMSTDGSYVSGAYFGGAVNYFWSQSTGVIQVSGTVYGVSDAGVTTGTFSNPNLQYNGSNVESAGLWDHTSSQWTFLGMNPLSPGTFSTDYNSGWDISSDGSTVVGLQYWPGYVYRAFKWTQTGGYTDIGNGVGQGSRASGISANGSVIFGWAQTSVSRTPVIWSGGQVIFINDAEWGEAFGASTTGNYITGTLGDQGFRWSPQGTVLFSNTLNPGSINPSTVTNSGEVFGYTDTSWPPNPAARRAFARDSTGVLMTFNDYAEARGLEDAQQWTFYSINDVSADGNKFLGAGKNPAGQNVTFIIGFPVLAPVISANPQSIDFGTHPAGTTSPYTDIVIKNGGGGLLELSGVTLGGLNTSQFLLQDLNTWPVNLGFGDSVIVSVAFKPTATGNWQAAVDISGPGASLQIPLTGNASPGVGFGEKPPAQFLCHPNPVSDIMQISCPEEIKMVRVINSLGQTVVEKPGMGSDRVNLTVKNLPGGYYHLICITVSGRRYTQLVVVSKP